MRGTGSAILLAMLMLGACVTLPPASAPEAQAADNSVYVTRHMEKADGDDPPLSADGAAAAERLADALANKGISAIFATPTRRAMETAAPLARRTGVQIIAYDPRNPQSLLTAAAASPGAVLVVGHSNTVHELVARLGGRNPPAPLSEEDYGAVFVINSAGEVEVFDIDE